MLTESRNDKIKSRNEAVFGQCCPRKTRMPSGKPENAGEKERGCQDGERPWPEGPALQQRSVLTPRPP